MPRAGGAAAAAPADDERHRDVVLGWIYEFLSRNRMEEAKEGAMAAAPVCARRRALCRGPRWPPLAWPGARAVLHACVAALHHALVVLLVKPCVRLTPAPCLGTLRVRPAGSGGAVLIKSAAKRFHVSSDTFLPHTDPVSVLQELLDVGEVRPAFPVPRRGQVWFLPRVDGQGVQELSSLLSCCAPLPAVVMLTELRADGSSTRHCLSSSCSWRTTRQTSAKSCTPKRCRASGCSR